MNIGIIKTTLHMPGNQSLKDKRKVVHSICQKLRNQFHVSVAEVELNDDLKKAVIGISFVSNDAQVIQGVTSKILSFLQQNMGDYALLGFDNDIIRGF